MESKFPGLDAYIAEEKLRNIKNSINRTLLENAEKPDCKMNPCFIIVLIVVFAGVALLTYACIKLI
jgi:hypothetical protein